jgi:hypothetical protein
MPFKKHKKKSTKNNSNNSSSSSSSSMDNELYYKNANRNKNKVLNDSYPYQFFGNNTQMPSYSVQIKKKLDDGKYFKNYKYDYNVQVNKPIMTYDNFKTQQELKNMTREEYCYYNKFQEKYYLFNGNFDVVNKKPNALAVQASLKYPMPLGPVKIADSSIVSNVVNEPNNQVSVNPNLIYGFNNDNVMLYTNSPVYTGVQAKSLPGQNLIAQQNYIQTQVNNANINSPAYANYGKYFY